MPSINPFGTKTSQPTVDIVPIKLFGCTVIDFNVSADWSSQGGSLSCRIIESDSDGDRLILPVLGSPVNFEAKDSLDNIIFQYIGIVDSFSRSSSNEKIYSVNLASPLKILDSTNVILEGYVGPGSSIEGAADFSGPVPFDFGHNNSLLKVDNTAGAYHWWNVSNLINVFGILENDDPLYRFPTNFDTGGNPLSYGGFGFSGRSQDGIPLIKLMWAMHFAINHAPPVNELQRQKILGGNLLFGRHNYNLRDNLEAVPYYYHFDAIHFYNQVVNKIGPEHRIEGANKSLTEIISDICTEANFEFFTYIDIYNDPTIGEETLQELDKYANKQAVLNWISGMGTNMSPLKFTEGGNYGGTIRVKTIDKNSFMNPYRPFSNIAYNLIGLEVPDLKDSVWTRSGIHPGKRPINYELYGLSPSGSASYQTYSDPLDSSGVQFWRGNISEIENDSWGFTEVGTISAANGGSFPVETGIFDKDKFNKLKIKSSEISIKLNDYPTMKVITGGYQTRLISAPRNLVRHYWGDITTEDPFDARKDSPTITKNIGLDETNSRKIPVVTPLLDPRDVDDYILIDMKSEFGPISITGVLEQGVYAASLMEVRCAMSSLESWKAFMDGYKYDKIRNMVKTFFPNIVKQSGQQGADREDLVKSTERVNACSGLGYIAVLESLGLGNTFASYDCPLVQTTHGPSGNTLAQPADTGSSKYPFGIPFTYEMAAIILRQHILPPLHEKIKEIGDTHYGKSWYVPVPYMRRKEDLDGANIVGNFKHSWELTDSSYVEPIKYYGRQIPQSNLFVQDGKVQAFVNYDHNFLSSNTGAYDSSYSQSVTNLLGKETNICNFSEYSLDQLCVSKYSPDLFNITKISGEYVKPTGDGTSGIPVTGVIGSIVSSTQFQIIHASPDSVDTSYSFLPVGYEAIYDRALLPFSDIITGQTLKFVEASGSGNSGIPDTEGQKDTDYEKDIQSVVSGVSAIYDGIVDIFAEGFDATILNKYITAPPVPENDPTAKSGTYQYDIRLGVPSLTLPDWLRPTVNTILSLDYRNDNGRFGFPYVKFTTPRVFLPVPKPGAAGNGMGDFPGMQGFNAFLGTKLPNSGIQRPKLMTEDTLLSVLKPFQACVVPKSFNYSQVSTRHVYGPWMTSFKYVPFRGRIEYEQDDSLVPENFLIPLNFGKFGTYELSQLSGLAGMNLAAQARSNAIDNFALFAIEEGSFTVPGGPAIKRVGDGLYGLQQITDIKINVSNSQIETTYTFKTISPKFGKNPRELEKKIAKISNAVKQLRTR